MSRTARALVAAAVMAITATACARVEIETRATVITSNITADDGELKVVAQNWVNSLGLTQPDPEVWRERLGIACAEGVWDRDVARRLAAEFIDEDLPLSRRVPDLGDPTADEGAIALWIMAAQVCREAFPPGAIETGPPTP